MNTYQQIVQKSGLADNADAMGLIDDFTKLYGTESPNEDMLERFIGMLGMLCSLPNYYQLHAEFCPSSRKNDPLVQEASEKVGKMLREMIVKGIDGK